MEIITYILGGTSIASIILFLIFFRQNRRLKNNEVSKSANEVESGKIYNDMAQIDLGNKYLNSILEATEKLNTYHTDYQNDIDSIIKDISEIKDDVKSIKKEQTIMSLYLNGKYVDFRDHITNFTLND